MNQIDLLSESNVAMLCVELDTLEIESGERVGGATTAEVARMQALEAAILAKPIECVDGTKWLARRLARAAANDWSDEALAPLVRALG